MGFGQKSGMIGAGYALHLGAPNNIYFPDEPFCNLKCPRDISPAKPEIGLMPDQVQRGRQPHSGGRVPGRGWWGAATSEVNTEKDV